MTKRHLFVAIIACLTLVLPLNAGADRSGLKSIIVVDDGRQSVVQTDVETVGDLVNRLEQPGTIARVFPDRSSRLMSGTHLFVYRQSPSKQPTSETVAAESIDVRSWALPEGRSMVIRGKKPGLRSEGGLTQEPVNRMVLRGQADHKNDRLAKLSDRGTMKLMATGYSPHRLDTYPYDDGLSAIGLPAGYGIVAVDPQVIPLGTRLYVEGYGYAIAADVGGDIEGRRIDLCFPKRKDALIFGRRWLNVHILE